MKIAAPRRLQALVLAIQGFLLHLDDPVVRVGELHAGAATAAAAAAAAQRVLPDNSSGGQPVLLHALRQLLVRKLLLLLLGLLQVRARLT